MDRCCTWGALLLVILGHAIRDEMQADNYLFYFIYRFLYSFHMNLFFTLAGITFIKFIKENTFFGFTVKKIKALLLPWASYSVAIYLIFAVASSVKPIQLLLSGTGYDQLSFMEYFVQSVKGDNPYAFHLWFIYALFITEIVIFLINRSISKVGENTKWIWLVLFILMTVVCTLVQNSNDFTIVRTVVIQLPWFVWGIVFEKFEIMKKIKNIKNGVALGILGILPIVFGIVIGDKIGFNMLLRVVRNFLGVPSIIFFYIFVARNIENSYIGEKLAKIGINSFSIYLLHQPFCCAFVGTVLLKILPSSVWTYIFCVIVSFILSLWVPRVIYLLSKKVHCDKILYKLFGIRFI